jgi:hypothetical protein
VLFDNYYFDDIKLVEIKENKLYATYWSYQTRNEPFRFEIDTVTKEVKDSFYNTETKSYSYVNPKPTFLAKLTKWLTKLKDSQPLTAPKKNWLHCTSNENLFYI